MGTKLPGYTQHGHARPSAAALFSQIEVGDLIVINNREAVPCDVLIVGVDEPISQSPAGVAYVETKSLDGETNLKIRQVHGYARE